jgi:uncharacterized protein (TIGR02996 family)
MSDNVLFLEVLRNKPGDGVTRLVYADWLDEQGGRANADQAAYLRTESDLLALPEGDGRRDELEARLRELAHRVPRPWLAVVSRRKVENCFVKLAFVCSKRWEEMGPTADERVRSCPDCHKTVHFCDDLAEAVKHARAGHCVAVSAAEARSEDDLQRRLLPPTPTLAGLPMPLPVAPPAAPRRSWWRRLLGRG